MSAPCAVALVMLLDASSSIEPRHWTAMLEGHADAVQSAGIVSIIERGDGVAVAARAFGDTTARLLGWRMLRTREDAEALSRAIANLQRPNVGPYTSIGAAIRDGAADLAAAPTCDEQVMDIVTDGQETHQPYAPEQRPAAEAMGYRINGLMVGSAAGADWMRADVVSQSGSAARAGFVLHAADWGEFADALRRKITVEIASR